MADREYCRRLEGTAKGLGLNAKSPFEDEELKRIYAACDKILPQLNPGPGFRTWDGQDAKDFINLSIYTGLRISDICLFDVSKRLDGNDVYLRMHKTGKPLYTWIPDWLVARLRARAVIHGSVIFRCGVTGNAKQLCDIWRNKRLKLVFKLAGPLDATVLSGSDPGDLCRDRSAFDRNPLKLWAWMANKSTLSPYKNR
jgi:integrase